MDIAPNSIFKSTQRKKPQQSRINTEGKLKRVVFTKHTLAIVLDLESKTSLHRGRSRSIFDEPVETNGTSVARLMETSQNNAYLINASAHHEALPSGMQNLQSILGLDDLAASVARVDAQGNKIAANKLNKTYKKQITDLGIPGAPDIPKNKYLMDLLMAGGAHQELEGGYKPLTAHQLETSFKLRPGPLTGYIRYRPPSPSLKRAKQETPQPTPIPTPTAQTFASSISQSQTYNSGQASRSNRASRVPTPSPPQTRSTTIPPAPPSVEDESSDDGSRFKELERERKKKLRMKREAEMSMGGDSKRRRYDVDGYEFLDSD